MESNELNKIVESIGVFSKSINKEMANVKDQMTPEQKKLMSDILDGKTMDERFTELTGKINELSKRV